MDYASQLMGFTNPNPQGAVPDNAEFDWATELAKPKTPKTPGDIEIANDGDTKGTAPFGTLVKGGMVEDPQTKIDIFAKSRFPNMPLEEARSRYGIIDGEVVYVGNDDKVYRETPSGVAGGLKRMAADVVSNAPAVVGGTVGAVAGAPAGPAASAGLAALGAAGGKGYGRVAAGMAFDEPQTVSGNVASMGKEAAFSAGSTLVGNYLGRVLSGVKARDIRKLNTGAVADIDRKAAAEGVELNVAQRTNLPSMKSRYDALASMPTSRDTVADFAQRQSQQANVAVERFLDTVSPVDGLDEAGTMARTAAGDVLKKLAKERATKAAPLYAEALSGKVTSTPQLRELFSRPSMAQAWRQAQTIAADEGVPLQIGKDIPAGRAFIAGQTERVAAGHGTRLIEKPGLLDAAGQPLTREVPGQTAEFSMRGLHYMKLALDKMIGDEAKGGLKSTSRRALMGLKDDLLNVMDESSPKDKTGQSLYKQARVIYSEMSPNIDSVKEGVIARIADLPDEKVVEAAKQMFNPNMSPTAVSRARELFKRAGRDDDWNALLRSYLQENFGKAGREYATAGGELGQSVRWRAMLFGDPAQRRVIRGAMTDEQNKAYANMMDVFDAMGRTYGAGLGSQTMPRQEAAAALRREAGAGVPGQVAAAFSPQTWGTRASQFLAEARLGKHAEKMAEIMTSPDGMKQLKELVKMSPTSQKFIAGSSALFGISVRPATRPSAEQVPSAAQ